MVSSMHTRTARRRKGTSPRELPPIPKVLGAAAGRVLVVTAGPAWLSWLMPRRPVGRMGGGRREEGMGACAPLRRCCLPAPHWLAAAAAAACVMPPVSRLGGQRLQLRRPRPSGGGGGGGGGVYGWHAARRTALPGTQPLITSRLRTLAGLQQAGHGFAVVAGSRRRGSAAARKHV